MQSVKEVIQGSALLVAGRQNYRWNVTHVEYREEYLEMKNALRLLVLVGLVGVLVSSAMANDVAQKVGLGVGIGLAKYDGEASLTDGSKYKSAKEMFVRYGLTSKVGVVFNYSLVELETDFFKTDIKPALDVRLLFTMFPEHRISPYVFTGAGLIDFTPTSLDPDFDVEI
jgi:hypothetical protein